MKSYIETGEPVSSKSLSSLLNLSSATIRNEMNALEQMGYLAQPHTSAGRVPTRKGFRLYIDKLMNRYRLTSEDKKQIQSMLPENLEDPAQALEQVSVALAELTRCAAISTNDTHKRDRIRRVEMIPIEGRSALLILLTEYGIVKSRICKCSYQVTPQRVERFLNFANRYFTAKELISIQPGSLQTAAASMGTDFLENMPLFTALFDLIQEASKSEVKLEGSTNLLEYEEFTPTKAKELLRFLTHRGAVLSVLSSLQNEFNVLLGDEINVKELETSGMVVAKYNFSEDTGGTIGVVGPIRMDYEHIIPSIEYMVQILESLFMQNKEEEK